METPETEPKPTPPPQRTRATTIVLFVLFVAVAIYTGLPQYVKARVRAAPNACINNLLQIDGAKAQWALEHKAGQNDPVNDSEVEQFIKGGKLTCPSGGVYTYGKVGAKPTCSFPDHSLKTLPTP